MLVLRTSELGTYRREEAIPLDPNITLAWAQTRLRSYPPVAGYTATPVTEPVTFVYRILFVFVWIHCELIVEGSENREGSQLRRS